LKINKTLWNRALTLDREFQSRGEEISRGKLQDALQISQAESQNIIFALNNKDIIRSEPEQLIAENEKAVVLCDIHIPFQDNLCVQSIMEYCLQNKIDTFILNGDVIDFYKISRFIKNPTKKSVSNEIEETRKFLTELRYNFPQSRIIFKQGNHELRMEHYIMSNASEIYDLISDLLPIKLNFKELNIEYIMEPFSIGKLWVLHGHEKPAGGNPEWVCNVMWQYVYDHFCVGHFHRTQEKTFKSISGQTFNTNAIGYCAGKMDYAILNKWNQGFMRVDFSVNGIFRTSNLKIQDGEIY
jgi:metallophosphoesterase superfamily enzyme